MNNPSVGSEKEKPDAVSFGQVRNLFSAPVELPAILDELGLGIIIMDTSRKTLFLNRGFEALTGFTRDEVRGVPCRHVLRANICGSNCPLIRADRDRATVAAEADIITRDRLKVPVRLSAAPLFDQKGNPVGFLETLEDMRPFKGAEDPIRQMDGLGGIIGRSEKMKALFRLVPVVAQTDSSILITGETGTGKDVLAEVIHKASDRADGPFIKINCGALPETLLESELLGHKKGAFTGAVNDKMGRLRLAHNGTLYLTEIGDLPLTLQVKLLTFLDDKIVHPLGSTDGFQADVRVIAATHRNLERMVNDGLFRQDLLFRLNVVRFQLPPLREREGDVSLLLAHFLKLFTERLGKRIKGFHRTAHQFLLHYPYPGNVRELRNIIEYAASFCSTDKIGIEHLPAYLFEEKGDVEETVSESREGLRAEPNQRTPAGELSWAAIERKLIVDTLLKVGGHKGRAAEILGWGRTTLWRKMKQYGLEE